MALTQSRIMSVPQATPDVRTSEAEPALDDLVASVLEVPRQRVNAGTSFIEDLGADSLDVLALVLALEEQFEVTISDNAAAQMKTVRDAMRCVQSRRDQPLGDGLESRRPVARRPR